MIHTVDPMREGEVDPMKFRNEVMQTLNVETLAVPAIMNGVTTGDDTKTEEDKREGSNGNIPSIHVTQVCVYIIHDV